jgi:CRP-like cAMP-binding protein
METELLGNSPIENSKLDSRRSSISQEDEVERSSSSPRQTRGKRRGSQGNVHLNEEITKKDEILAGKLYGQRADPLDISQHSLSSSVHSRIRARSSQSTKSIETAYSNQDRLLQSKLLRREFSIKQPQPPPAASIRRSHSRLQDTTDSLMRHISTYFRPICTTEWVYHEWNRLITLLCLVSVFNTPYRISFESDLSLPSASYVVELTCDMIFCFDFLLHCFHIVPESLMLQWEKRDYSGFGLCNSRFEICSHFFMRTQAYLKFFSAIPWDFIVSYGTGGTVSGRVEFALGLFRLPRAMNILKALSRSEKNVKLPYFYVRLVKFLLLVVANAHFFGCIFYFVAYNESGVSYTWLDSLESSKPHGLPKSDLNRYLVALYWAVVTMSTVGYGDITPQNQPEYIVNILFMIVNIFLIAWVVGNMTLLVTQYDEFTREFRNKFHCLARFIKCNLLPNDIKKAMISFMVLQFNASEEHKEIVEEFPPFLKTKVNRIMYRPTIDASFFSSVVSDAFLDSLLCLLDFEILMPGTDAIMQYDAAVEMYFVVSGSLDVLFDDGGIDDDYSECEYLDSPSSDSEPRETSNLEPQHVKSYDSINAADHASRKIVCDTLSAGDTFGETSFFFNVLQPFTIRTNSVCRFLVLRRGSWESLKSLYPQDSRLVLHEVARQLKERLSQNTPRNDAESNETDFLNMHDGNDSESPKMQLYRKRRMYEILDHLNASVQSSIANMEQSRVSHRTPL